MGYNQGSFDRPDSYGSPSPDGAAYVVRIGRGVWHSRRNCPQLRLETGGDDSLVKVGMGAVYCTLCVPPTVNR